jgi:curved DNA-binding protein
MAMEFKDYYDILGVSRNASADDIKRAYRKLARKYHPDVSKEPQAETRFKEVGEAYEVLKDPEKRKLYDQLGSDWRAGQDFRPPPGWESRRTGTGGGFSGEFSGDFSDFFEALFGGGSPFGRGAGAGGRRAGFAFRGEDQNARITISLEEAYSGATRSITVETVESDGMVQRRVPKALRVRIPKGVRNGQRIRLAGQGNPGSGGGSAGDLYLEVHIAPHRLFHLRGRDIHLELPVAPWEAALGARLKVPTLGGEVDMRIPANSQSGKRLRLRGRGLPGDPPGDQYVTLRIVNPPAAADRGRELFERMAKDLDFDPRAALAD